MIFYYNSEREAELFTAHLQIRSLQGDIEVLNHTVSDLQGRITQLNQQFIEQVNTLNVNARQERIGNMRQLHAANLTICRNTNDSEHLRDIVPAEHIINGVPRFMDGSETRWNVCRKINLNREVNERGGNIVGGTTVGTMSLFAVAVGMAAITGGLSLVLFGIGIAATAGGAAIAGISTAGMHETNIQWCFCYRADFRRAAEETHRNLEEKRSLGLEPYTPPSGWPELDPEYTRQNRNNNRGSQR